MPQPRLYITSLSEEEVLVSIRIPLLSQRYPDVILQLAPSQSIVHQFDYGLHLLESSLEDKGEYILCMIVSPTLPLINTQYLWVVHRSTY